MPVTSKPFCKRSQHSHLKQVLFLFSLGQLSASALFKNDQRLPINLGCDQDLTMRQLAMFQNKIPTVSIFVECLLHELGKFQTCVAGLWKRIQPPLSCQLIVWCPGNTETMPLGAAIHLGSSCELVHVLQGSLSRGCSDISACSTLTGPFRP